MILFPDLLRRTIFMTNKTMNKDRILSFLYYERRPIIQHLGQGQGQKSALQEVKVINLGQTNRTSIVLKIIMIVDNYSKWIKHNNKVY